MKIKLVVIIVSVFQYFLLTAQELPIYQQYLLNPSLINPAITSYEGCTSLALSDRHQWIGILNAPSTQIIGLQKGIYGNSNKIHGIGLNLYHDNNGAFRKIGGDLLYSYHFMINRQKNIKIGLGLSISIFQNSINESDFTPIYDPIISGSVEREIIPDGGAGLYLYNSNFFAGLSGIRLLSFSRKMQEIERHFYLNSGLFISNAKSSIMFEPSILIKITESFKKQIDINFTTFFNEKYWYTISYRNNLNTFPGQSISLTSVFGITFGNFALSYSFDLGLTKIQLYNYGSHEFMIRYKICSSDNNDINCPTYKGLIKRYRTR